MIDFTHLLVGALLAKASFAFPTPFANFARAAGDTCPASVVSCQNVSGVNSCCVETPGVRIVLVIQAVETLKSIVPVGPAIADAILGL